VFLAEPPPHEWDFHFSLLGYPVRIHFFFWIMALMMGINLKDPVLVGIWVVAVALCILLHEMGHAVVMRAYGYFPSIVLYAFGGLAIPHAGRYGMPRPGPWGQILILFAGPASGFILTAILVLGLHYGGYRVEIFDPTWRDVIPRVDIANPHLHAFVYFVFEISVMWGLLNLLPIYPLDGGQIAQELFYLNNPRDAVRPALILSVIVGGLMVGVALVQWHDIYVALLFIWMTYSNFQRLQSIHGSGGW
jgi:stage IV sporulation protein FB